MTTEDVIRNLKLAENFENKSATKNIYIKINYNSDKSEADMFLIIESDYGWDEPHNMIGYFGKIHKINDGIFYISRFIYQNLGKKPQFPSSLEDKFNTILYRTLVINNVEFKLHVIGNNYIYISNDLEEDQQLKLNEFETLVRVNCTKKSVLVPSKSAFRYFIVISGGFLLIENVNKPVRYKYSDWGETLDSSAILTLASSKNKTAKPKEEIRKVYFENMTNALLNITKTKK